MAIFWAPKMTKLWPQWGPEPSHTVTWVKSACMQDRRECSPSCRVIRQTSNAKHRRKIVLNVRQRHGHLRSPTGPPGGNYLLVSGIVLGLVGRPCQGRIRVRGQKKKSIFLNSGFENGKIIEIGVVWPVFGLCLTCMGSQGLNWVLETCCFWGHKGLGQVEGSKNDQFFLFQFQKWHSYLKRSNFGQFWAVQPTRAPGLGSVT